MARSGASICRIRPGFMDGLVFVLHLARDRIEIIVMRLVEGVEHRGRNDAGRGRGHEPFGKCAELVRDLVEARRLLVDRLEILVLDVGLRFRRALLAFGRAREAAHQVGQQFGKFLELAPAPALRHAGESGHALRHVGLERNAALLAVIADVDAGFHLLADDVAHRLVHLGRHHLRVVILAFLLRHQQVGELLVARQAADMGGEDAVAAENHRKTPYSRHGRACHCKSGLPDLQQV